MRAALPLKATNTREERARANALRAQIDELVVARAEADRALAEERQRADRLNEQVEALSAEVVRAAKQAEAVVDRAERAEAGRDAERARAAALYTSKGSAARMVVCARRCWRRRGRCGACGVLPGLMAAATSLALSRINNPAACCNAAIGGSPHGALKRAVRGGCAFATRL
jgi:chromosome segregation ATPase